MADAQSLTAFVLEHLDEPYRWSAQVYGPIEENRWVAYGVNAAGNYRVVEESGMTKATAESLAAALNDETPLRWERPRIVSTHGSTAAGTPQPQGWEA